MYLVRFSYDVLPVHRQQALALIQQEVETPIARQLVKGELKDGDSATVEMKNDGLVIVPTVTKS